MIRRNGAEARKERIQKIAQLIQARLRNENEISFSKTMTALQYEFGLTEERILQYLKILENLNQFAIDEKHDKIKKTIE
jgi:ribonucleotide reductase beta subunit family protein with ferritin-like domain